MMRFLLTALVVLVLLLALVGFLGYFVDLLLEDKVARGLLETQVAAPASALDPQVPARAPEHCSVPFCHDEVVVHIPAGFDRWPFCLNHGMPYLRSDQDVAA